MPYKGFSAITIKEELYKKLNEKLNEDYKDKKVKPSLASYVSDILWNVIESEEILRKYGPFLEKFAIEPDKIFIKDNRLDRIAELVLRDGDLYCILDESFNCVHIGFAWSIPEVYKAMELHGKKMPKIK
ncbi:MAG: hypothetical protein QXD42_06845 [Nitrososphaerales archaeon]